ncbi:MAG: hypothetical protein RL215_1381, partial [Planctomycetota bacterium]
SSNSPHPTPPATQASAPKFNPSSSPPGNSLKAAKHSLSPRASTAIALSMKPEINSPSSDASAHAPSRSPNNKNSTSSRTAPHGSSAIPYATGQFPATPTANRHSTSRSFNSTPTDHRSPRNQPSPPESPQLRRQNKSPGPLSFSPPRNQGRIGCSIPEVCCTTQLTGLLSSLIHGLRSQACIGFLSQVSALSAASETTAAPSGKTSPPPNAVSIPSKSMIPRTWKSTLAEKSSNSTNPASPSTIKSPREKWTAPHNLPYTPPSKLSKMPDSPHKISVKPQP